jgi:glucose/arabinose dehydrogenase
MGSAKPSPRLWPLLVLALSSLTALPALQSAPAAAAVPTGFREYIVFSGLDNPTSVEFAADGRVFVAEKRGVIKVFDGVDDPTPAVFADLRTNVYNQWDRGLLGFKLHPQFPANPSMYVLYTYDAMPGGTAPRWGSPGADVDPCPTPPGPTDDGCVVQGRLSRLTVSGNSWTGTEDVFITDWCQQYPSHSIGSIAFGSDGAMYVTGGDGASFNWVDYGQDGNPLNPCGDPPAGVGGVMIPPTAEGGALRSQDVRTSADPTSLDGAVLRLDPATGQALPDNPLAGSSDANTRRIIAYGLRNPFRMTVRPGTSEVWVGDVGWSTWEELNRTVGNDAVVDNLGWPCYEGVPRQGGYDGANLTLCESLYTTGPVTAPQFAWRHGQAVVPGETCSTSSGSSSAGVAIYPGGRYPDDYDNALFFADYSRDCIWVMRAGAGGQPDPTLVANFVTGAANPVELEVGPDGDLWYVDLGGTIRRVGFNAGNQPPLASVSASPTSGSPPLTVAFDARGSSDPDAGDTLTYVWDLDGDGAFDDATGSTASFTYTTAGPVTAAVRVTDAVGASDTASVVITVGETAPVPVIDQPAGTTEYAVGNTVSFAGHATDPQDGTLPPSALSWSADLMHCSAPGACHTHPDLFAQPGVAGGTFVMPDHEYSSQILLKLTATAGGETVTTTRLINYQTVNLTFATNPSGIDVTVGGTTSTTPFTRPAHVGGRVSVSAPATAVVGDVVYQFTGWSDGGGQAHDITVPAAPTTYTATYQPLPGTVLFNDTFEDGDSAGWQVQTGTWSVCRPPGQSLAYCATSSADSVSLTGDTTWADYSVEAAVRMPNDRGGATVIGRAQDATHWYQLQLKRVSGKKRWLLERRNGSTMTTLASGPYGYAANQSYILRLGLEGSILTAWISADGGGTFSRLGSATSTAITGGRIGLRSSESGISFDTVRVIKR